MNKATFEQVQAAVRREEAARAAYEAAKADYEARCPKGSAVRLPGPPAFSTLDTPEGREYDAASAELTRLRGEVAS